MYLDYYGFREAPFTLLPDPEFLYLTEQHRMAFSLMEYGVWSQSMFSVITGEIGTGKTTLIRHLLDRLDDDVLVGLISNTHGSFGDLLQWIMREFDLDASGRDKIGMHSLLIDFFIAQYAQNRRIVLIIDEAQNISRDSLEELRMLSNINAEKDNVLQVILVGQPGLREMLSKPDLEQFAQRIAVDFHLRALSREECYGYIRHRLRQAGGRPTLFDDGACAVVFRYSGGIPRLINLLCDTILVYGYADEATTLGAGLADEVAREKINGGIFPSPTAYAGVDDDPGKTSVSIVNGGGFETKVE